MTGHTSEQLRILPLRPLRPRRLLERPYVVPRREVELFAVQELLDGQELRPRVLRAGGAGVEAGVGGLAADTPEEFVRVGASIVNDPQGLRDQRREMRRRLLSTALLDHQRFTRGLEAAYRRMWETWATNGTPVGFEV